MVFVAIGATLLVAGFWFLQAQKAAQQKAVETNLLSVAKLKIQEIQTWRDQRLADAAIMMGRKALIDDVQRYFRHPTEREASGILRRLRDVKERYHYADIWVVGPDRRIRLSLESKPAVLDQAYDKAFAAAVATHKPAWTDFHTGHGRTQVHLSVVAPLFLAGSGRRPIGAIVLICDPAQFLYPLIQSWPTPSQTAETLLIRRDGDEVLFLNDLRRLNYTVLEACSPGKAIEMAQACGEAIHLLVTDVVMPDMNGRELSEALTRTHPNLKTLFMSGYTADVIAHRGVLDSGAHFIHKPFSRKELATKVREALASTG
jgi:CheY-like chemotaxis protein